MDFYVLAEASTDAQTAWELLRQGGPMVWVLLIVSAFGITAFLERLLYYHRAQINASEFMAGVRTVLKNDNVVEAVAICDATPGPVGMIFIFNSRTMKRYVRPISFRPVREACPISSSVLGTPHCLQAA